MSRAVRVCLASILIVCTGGCGFRKGPGRNRGDAEIAALSTALESFKADHGFYPSDPHRTDLLRPGRDFSPKDYMDSSAFLYEALSGVRDGKVYFEFSPAMLKTDSWGVTYIVDPWGNSYGYSTFGMKNPKSPESNGPFFELWSTGGGSKEQDRHRWVKSW